MIDEGPERAEVDDELPRTARQALELSRAAELGAVPSAPRASPDAAPPASPTEVYPDRAFLEKELPRFDAATQVVAARIVVEGMEERAVAAALGISRRSVSRKLSRFLQLARQHVAVALALTAAAGCAGAARNLQGAAGTAPGDPRASPPALVRSPAPDPAPSPPGRSGDGARAVEQPPSASLRYGPAPATAARAPARAADLFAHRIGAQVARRMPGQSAAVHERVSRTIVAEAERADLDPLLVIALIGVESSFNPDAVSSAGAIGLMQLRVPTMRREAERGRLDSLDPRDPVANVRAGVRYLRRLIDAFGEVDVALMAYNAGPNRIRGHMRRGEVPVRFLVYPRRVNHELERLRTWLAGAAVAEWERDARPGTKS